MKQADRSFSKRSNYALNNTIRRLSFLKRLDLIVIAIVTAIALVICGGVAATYQILISAGIFDAPLITQLVDERILANVRQELPEQVFLDAIIDAHTDQVIISQQQGRIHTYNPTTNLWDSEVPFSPDTPVSSSFVALRSGCETTQIVGTRSHCDDPGGLWALGEDGSLARRLNGQWQVVRSNTAFLSADGVPIDHEQVTTGSVSSDSRWLLLATSAGNLGLYSLESHLWHPVTSPDHAVTAIRSWKNRFVLASPEGLLVFDPARESAIHPQTTAFTGEILDLVIDSENSLWILELVDCEDTAGSCRRLSRVDNALTDPPTILMEQRNRFEYLSLEGLHYAQQIGQFLWLVGDEGIYTYNLTLRQWQQFAPSAPSITLRQSDERGFYFVDRNQIHLIRDNELASSISVAPQGEDITQLVRESDTVLYAVTSSSKVFWVDAARNQSALVYEPRTTAANPETFHSAYYAAGNLIFIGTNGLLLHNPETRTYEDVQPTDLPAWFFDPRTKWHATDSGVFALVQRGDSDDVYALPTNAFSGGTILEQSVSRLIPITFTAPSITWLWENQLGVRDGSGVTSRLDITGEQTELIGDAALTLTTDEIRDVLEYGDTFIVLTDTELYRYDLTTRSWSEPVQPVIENNVTLTEMFLASDKVYLRTSDGKLRNEQGEVVLGGTEAFRLTDETVSDVMAEGSSILFAGNGAIDRYNPENRSVENLHTLPGNAPISLVGRVDDGLVSLSDAKVYLDSDSLALPDHPVTQASVHDNSVLAVHVNGDDRYLVSYDTVTGTTTCLFRQPVAEGARSVLDARAITDRVTAVLTDNGLHLYDLQTRSWFATNTGRGATRLYSLGTFLLLSTPISTDEFRLEAFALENIVLPDSCSRETLRIPSEHTFVVRSYAVNEPLGRLALLGTDGRVAEWYEGQTTVILPGQDAHPAVLRQLLERVNDEDLLFNTDSGLWVYNLTLRTWRSIPLIRPDGQTMTNPSSVNVLKAEDNTYFATVDEGSVVYAGQLTISDERVELERLWDGVTSQLGRNAADFVAAYMTETENVWVFLFSDGLHYFDPIARNWIHIGISPRSASYHLHKLSNRWVLVDEENSTWLVASTAGELPLGFAVYNVDPTDIDFGLDNTGMIWRLTNSAEVVLCQRDQASYRCNSVQQPFVLNSESIRASYEFNDSVILEDTQGLRRFDIPQGIERELPNTQGFRAISAAFSPDESSLILYSDENNELLTISRTWNVTRYNDIQRVIQDGENEIWAQRSDGWWRFRRDSVRFEPDASYSGTAGTYARWQSSTTRLAADGRVAYFTEGRWITDAVQFPTNFPTTEIRDVIRGGNNDWWVIYEGRIDHMALAQCVSTEQWFPVATQLVTEAARVTETAVSEATQYAASTATSAAIITATESALNMAATETQAAYLEQLAQFTATQAAQDVSATETAMAILATRNAVQTVRAPLNAAATVVSGWMPPSFTWPTIVPTPTLSPTPTATLTLTPTPTFTVTPSPTATFTPSLTSTPIPINCYVVMRSGELRLNGDVLRATVLPNASLEIMDTLGVSFTVRPISGDQLISEQSITDAPMPHLPLEDTWTTRASFVKALPNGNEVFWPIEGLQTRGDFLFGRREDGVSTPINGVPTILAANRTALSYLRAGWIAWNADEAAFQISSPDGYNLLTPDEFIQDGALVFEGMSEVTATETTIQAANPYGFWSFTQPNLILTDPNIQFQPQVLAGRIQAFRDGFIADGLLYSDRSGEFTGDPIQPIISQIERVTFTEIPLSAELDVELEVLDSPRLDAWTDKGFLWDADRREIAFDRDLLLINSRAGIHNPRRYDLFGVRPTGVQPGTLGLRPGTMGEVYFERSGRWYQPSGLAWDEVANPIANRELISTDQWDWRLTNSNFEVVLQDTEPYAFALLNDEIGFTSDALNDAVMHEGFAWISTRAFLERPVFADAFSGALRAFLPPRTGEFILARDVQNQPMLYHNSDGEIALWDVNAGQFIASGDPRLNRELAQLGRLQIALVDGQIIKRLLISETDSEPLMLRIDEGRLSSDVVLTTTVLDGKILLGTASGIQQYPSDDFAMTAIEAVTDISAEGSDEIKVLGIDAASPDTLIALNDETCIQQPASSDKWEPCVSEDLTERLRIASPFWQWTQSPADRVLTGRYFDLNHDSLATSIIELHDGRLPHDRLSGATYCEGAWITTWDDWASITNSTEIQNFRFDSMSEIRPICINDLDDTGSSTTTGVFITDGARVFRPASTNRWVEVPRADRITVLEREAQNLFYSTGRLRVSAPTASQPVMEQRSLDGRWHTLEWQEDPVLDGWSLAVDQWHSVAVTDGRLWAQTPEGWLQHRLTDSFDAVLDLEDFLIVRELRAQSTGCTVSDQLTAGDTLVLRCNNSPDEVYSGQLSLDADMDVFVASADPFNDVQLVYQDGLSITLRGHQRGDAGYLEGVFRDEPLILQDGMFSHDAITAIEAFDDRILSLDSDGRLWDNTARITFALATAERIVPVTESTVIARIVTARADNSQFICLEAETGETFSIAAGALESYGQTCSEYVGHAGLWQYNVSEGSMVIHRSDPGTPTHERRLIAGRFEDDVLTGLPVSTRNGARIIHYLPTRLGIVSLDTELNMLDVPSTRLDLTDSEAVTVLTVQPGGGVIYSAGEYLRRLDAPSEGMTPAFFSGAVQPVSVTAAPGNAEGSQRFRFRSPDGWGWRYSDLADNAVVITPHLRQLSGTPLTVTWTPTAIEIRRADTDAAYSINLPREIYDLVELIQTDHRLIVITATDILQIDLERAVQFVPRAVPQEE
jgi:hypothetical protein